jgi:hypothetical protein
VYPGKRYLYWALDDPAGRSVDDVRPIRDDVERRVRALLAELGVPRVTWLASKSSALTAGVSLNQH